MEKELYRKNALAMIELVICALHGETPEQELIETLDLELLFKVCQAHLLTTCVDYALESAGIRDQKFIQAKEKAIRKNILLDAERKKILDRLEEEQIWYMPLKGAILKDWYPKLGMRQMSDNDILYDKNRHETVVQIMEDEGFTLTESLEAVDAFIKKPIYNFEMHGDLFMSYQVGSIAGYYHDIKKKLQKDGNNAYGYHFSKEDFYLFMLAHEYKHYSISGTGVRSLVDTYVFLKKYDEGLDQAYIRTELQKLGISEYEKSNRELALKVFDRQRLTKQEAEMLENYLFSGTYGTMQNQIRNEVENQSAGSKTKYVFRRIFPSMDYIERNWNFFYRHKWLIPALWIYRPFAGLAKNQSKLKAEMKYLRKKDK